MLGVGEAVQFQGSTGDEWLVRTTRNVRWTRRELRRKGIVWRRVPAWTRLPFAAVSASIEERSPPRSGGLRTGGNVMARNARAHIEQIVAGDSEIQEEYEALRLRRAIIAQLRTLRERKGWTQQQLADAAGMPRSAIARLESGGHSPRLETLHAVAHVLGYDVDVRFKRRRVAVA